MTEFLVQDGWVGGWVCEDDSKDESTLKHAWHSHL